MIKHAFFDIDGILTDGSVYVDASGMESKKITFSDIDAVFALKRHGIKIGFITGENTPFSSFVKKRFSPDFFASGCKDKLEFFRRLERKSKVRRTDACYAGDSLKDVPLMRYLDLSFTPSDTDAETKSAAKVVCRSPRGGGVIQEISRFLLSPAATAAPAMGQRQSIPEVIRQIDEHSGTVSAIRGNPSLCRRIAGAAAMITRCLKTGHTVLLCGNGGSAADAQHLATEFVSRFKRERRAFDAEALNINASSMTAIGNDYSFEKIFSRQIEAKGHRGDVLWAFSTSGTSPNVLVAVETAKRLGLTTIGMTGGAEQAPLARLSDCAICVPSRITARIQESHILIGHIICDLVESTLSKEK